MKSRSLVSPSIDPLLQEFFSCDASSSLDAPGGNIDPYEVIMVDGESA